jgi:hypothetical protein
MPYNVIFTITSAGSDSGPYNISGTTSDNVTTEIANNVSKSTLLAGFEVTISDDNITGGTVASVGTCTNSQPWIKPTGETPPPSGVCWSLTYDVLSPTTDQVRYRTVAGDVVTVDITGLEPIENGDGTATVYICVATGESAYTSPVCVVSGQEGVCTQGTWTTNLCPCENNGTCLIPC